jgi:transcriptional regulator with XRE-family HTH domain
MPRPSLRRRRLVGALRRLREEAGFTLGEAAKRADFSHSKLSRIEKLQLRINSDDVRTLCEVFEVDKETTEALAHLARQVRRRGWWHVYPDDVLGRFVDFVELETDAKSINEFAVDVIPGLLQTADYAKAVIRHAFPAADEDTIAQRVKLRAERQERWYDRKFEYWAIVDEAALRRPIGSATIMEKQLEQLAALASTPWLTLQVLPTDISGHMALGTPYILIRLLDRANFVYLDTLTGGLYLEDESDIDVYQLAWKRLAATALDFDRSVALIDRIADGHRRSHG